MDPFPADFLWGAATSAYQIEGSPLADGAGASNWHRYAHTPGAIHNGDTGDAACDHYRRFGGDVDLMRTLGLNAYRFSIAWGRVLPQGTGRVNGRGLGFYERLVDALRGHGIEPAVTLYHWDLPVALEDRGAWVNPDSAGWFADYARVLFRRLGDRVRLWITLNEPWVVVDAGHVHGVHPPGQRDLGQAAAAGHNLLRAHGLAVQCYRSEGRGRIGLTVNLEPKYPASERPRDREAARRAHAYMNRQFLDPVMLGRYPQSLSEIYGGDWRSPPQEELALIRQPIDFLGVNYYTRALVRDEQGAWPTRAGSERCAEGSYTETGWEVYPQGFLDTLLWVKDRYGDIPLYVTENGAAFLDPPPQDGNITDLARIAYLREHLRMVHEALRAGVDLRGYFVWSLLDNFEWQHGYAKRFGIVHVDYASQRRTPKASARFYRRVIESGGAELYSDPESA